MSNFIAFVETMPFWYWFIFAGILLVGEVLTGSTYLLWPATAAIIVGLFAIFPFSGDWQIQLLIFGVLTTILTLVIGPKIKPWLHRAREDHELLNERGASKIGRMVSVENDFQNGAGKVRLDDSLWLARSEEGLNHPAGSSLEISKVDGTVLIVRVGA